MKIVICLGFCLNFFPKVLLILLSKLIHVGAYDSKSKPTKVQYPLFLLRFGVCLFVSFLMFLILKSVLSNQYFIFRLIALIF